jgi:prolyl-tRNA synthetase
VTASTKALHDKYAANENSKNKSNNEYILNSTHEELITPIGQDYGRSYKDFPFAYYQIQTKFRNEPRAKSGLLRGREFRMKDLYSFHINEEDFINYYENAKQVYMDVYNELSIGEDTYIASASGGDFTHRYSHEFQTVCDTGEDTIYIDKVKKVSYNKEVVSKNADENIKNFGYDISKLPQAKACEVGNIFPLETKFTKAFNFQYTDKDNQKKLVEFMGCYGIGSSRIMGILAEKFGDEKGLVWPKAVAPFQVQIVSLHKEKNDEIYKKCQEIYNDLTKNNWEVLWDDRDLSPGNKLSDADLYGIPVQIVLGQKGLEKNVVEVKQRKTGDIQEVSLEDLYVKFEGIWRATL